MTEDELVVRGSTLFSGNRELGLDENILYTAHGVGTGIHVIYYCDILSQ